MTSNITAPKTWICRMRTQNYDWDVAFYRQSTVYISESVYPLVIKLMKKT